MTPETPTPTQSHEELARQYMPEIVRCSADCTLYLGHEECEGQKRSGILTSGYQIGQCDYRGIVFRRSKYNETVVVGQPCRHPPFRNIAMKKEYFPEPAD